MIASLRKGHRFMFAVLGMALPVVFVVGLYERKSVPVMALLPAGLVANRPVSGSPVLLKTCAFPRTSASAKLFGTQKGDELTIQISTGNEPEKPDVLVYWVPGTPSGLDKVPTGAFLLGELGSQSLSLPVGERPTGVLMLYSLADGEVIDVSNPITL
jgi:hypothetical protein